MSEWLVRLVGRERDLRCFATTVPDPWRVTEEEGNFYLRSSRFEKLGDAGEVKRVADEFVDWADLHALVRFVGFTRASAPPRCCNCIPTDRAT